MAFLNERWLRICPISISLVSVDFKSKKCKFVLTVLINFIKSSMKYIIDVADNKKAFIEEFFKSISFVKKVKSISENEITNPTILKSIDLYEKNKVKPQTISIEKLKKMLNA